MSHPGIFCCCVAGGEPRCLVPRQNSAHPWALTAACPLTAVLSRRAGMRRNFGGDTWCHRGDQFPKIWLLRRFQIACVGASARCLAADKSSDFRCNVYVACEYLLTQASLDMNLCHPSLYGVAGRSTVRALPLIYGAPSR